MSNANANANRYKFNELLNDYTNRLMTSNSHYLFYIKKCCGWGYLTSIPKRMTFRELYRQIGCEMSNHDIRLYATDNSERMNASTLVSNNERPLYELVHNDNLKPYFNMPAPVVYCLMLDDKHYNNQEYEAAASAT